MRDDGVGMPLSAPMRTGLGTSIIGALAGQLDATVEVTPKHPGTQVSIKHAQIVLVEDGAETDDDLLAQAEHDVSTRVGLITTDRALGEATLEAVERQLLDLPTADVAGVAWRDHGEIVLCADEQTMLDRSDFIAAEHLQVHTRDPHATAQKLRNYGSLFIGPLASVVYSDKCCGTNHTLPTLGAGRYTGGLWVGSYVKICTHQWLDARGVAAVAPPAIRQSATEGMEGHPPRR